jgi:ankyrin repeat protein
LDGAALNGDVRLLQMLLDQGANPNIKNKLGGTPLMWAASYGYQDAVQLLLAKGRCPPQGQGRRNGCRLGGKEWSRKSSHRVATSGETEGSKQ